MNTHVRFIDIDASFSITTEAGDVKGYTVVRAPKGEKESYFFSKGNSEAIRAYVGLETSSYPDIAEAIAFNQEFGLYISAPAGSSEDYPSYFGGAYVTNEGLIPLYNVTSKDAIDYTKNSLISELGDDTQLNILMRKDNPYEGVADGNKETLAFAIGPIPNKNWASLKEIAIDYWGDNRTGHEKGAYYYTIDKDDHKIYVEDEDGLPIKDYYCGCWFNEPAGNFIILGGSDWLFGSENTEVDYGTVASSAKKNVVLNKLGIKATSDNAAGNMEAPFFTLDGLCKFAEESATIEDAPVKWATLVDFFSKGEAPASFVGTEFFIGSDLYKVGDAKRPTDNFTGLIDIKDKTYAVLVQKSPCERVTTVKVTNMGYDKYKYDNAMIGLFGDLSKMTAAMVGEFASTYGIEDFVYLGAKGCPTAEQADYAFKVYHIDTDRNGDKAKDVLVEKTPEYVSQDFLITKTIQFTGTFEFQEYGESKITNSIFYCLTKSKFMIEKEDDNNFPLRKDIAYNTMSFSVAEEIYPGQQTSGGEFTGSFDENGKDSYGSNIYWPNVLNESDFSFLEIIPVKTYDDDVNNKGIYTGERICDDVLSNDMTGHLCGKTTDIKLKGQRFVTHVVEQNIKNGMVGGAWNDDFEQIIRDGWTEAYDENYDDVFVFMGLTGQPTEVTNLASIVSGTHKLAIAIAPFQVTKPTFNNPNTMVVPTRSKQLALFAGEFQVYDPYTGKNHWITPMGDIGKMCARIFDRKMGGWPPAWYNYNDMGGQLSRPVLKARWNFKDSDTKVMDTKGINPIVYNPDDGLMIVSSKTTQDPNNLTDWSFLEHVMSFVLLKREIRDNVMRPQIKKPIDGYWMNIRQKQVDAILAKRTQGANRIWTAAKCDIAGVNNDMTKAQRDFRIDVKVKVTPFAETVTLTLTNVDQTTSV